MELSFYERIVWLVEQVVLLSYSIIGTYLLQITFFEATMVVILMFLGMYFALIILGYIGVYWCAYQWVDSDGVARYYSQDVLRKWFTDWFEIVVILAYVMTILVNVILFCLGVIEATKHKHPYIIPFLGLIVLYQIAKISARCLCKGPVNPVTTTVIV